MHIQSQNATDLGVLDSMMHAKFIVALWLEFFLILVIMFISFYVFYV